MESKGTVRQRWIAKNTQIIHTKIEVAQHKDDNLKNKVPLVTTHYILLFRYDERKTDNIKKTTINQNQFTYFTNS